jgi:hypothetical protein
MYAVGVVDHVEVKTPKIRFVKPEGERQTVIKSISLMF